MQKHKGKIPHFHPPANIDIFAIPFLDKAREDARQKRIQQQMAAGGKNTKLLQAEKRKSEKERKAEKRRQVAKEKGRNPDKKRGKNARMMDDWDDLAKEERLYKKLRKGKISQEDLDAALYDL